jgi:alcohol dehydrogenase class IV
VGGDLTAAPAFAGRLVNPRSDGVIYGPNVAETELPALLDRLGSARTFLVTTPSLERSGLADSVAGWLGSRCVGMFAGSREHTPAPVVIAAAAAARAADADGLVSLGGSSVVDLTKGVALLLAEGKPLADLRIRAGAPRPDLRATKAGHIAVPTTLSGAEFTAVAGITDPDVGEKQMYADSQLLPRWVVFDSVLAASCPPRLWAGTGMKVLADTIEVLCARRANPQSDALALGALRLLVDHLPTATAAPDDHDARGRCQFAVAMVFPQLAAVGVGLVAALRHQLGGGLGVPHGEASTIVLPHVMRYNLPVGADQYQRAADAIGVPTPDVLIARIEALTAQLGLPARLRDVGIERSDLDGPLVEHVLADGGARRNIVPADADAVRRILANAW